MYRTSFETFIRSGGGGTFTLNTIGHPPLAMKQDRATTESAVRQWVDQV
ncbi:hypothetical protein [Frigidibacter sp. SD6-1]|nr:hypothetical protein [Frigidibacter sp. SD6-1]